MAWPAPPLISAWVSSHKQSFQIHAHLTCVQAAHLSLLFPTKKHHLALTLGLHHPLSLWPSGSVAQRLISMRAFDECSRKADRKCHHQKCVPLYIEGISSFIQFSSVTQSCLILCNPMDCSMPGFPVHHHLLEFTQTYVHRSMMPSNHLILCRPLLLLPSVFPSIRVFFRELALHISWPKYWSLTFRISPSSA